jgi:hypothetical protein
MTIEKLNDGPIMFDKDAGFGYALFDDKTGKRRVRVQFNIENDSLELSFRTKKKKPEGEQVNQKKH